MLHILTCNQSNLIDSILDAEKEFKIFRLEHNHFGSPSRYIRLNPDLGEEPPALDDKAQMRSLQATVAKLFKTPEYELMTERIAYRLIASSFYFEKTEPIEHDEVESHYICKGALTHIFMSMH